MGKDRASTGNEKDQNEYIMAQEKRMECHRCVLNLFITAVITAILVEVVLRFLEANREPLVIFTAEICFVAIALLVVTMKFMKLAENVFEGEFKDEQIFFKKSLIMFLTTYGIRFAFLIVCIRLFEVWIDFFYNSPVWAAFTQAAIHLFYDALPVVYIML